MPLVRLALACCCVALASCSEPTAVTPDPSAPDVRGFRLGFSAAPPRYEQDLAYHTVNAWSSRADIALVPVPVPWEALLGGEAAGAIVVADYLPIVRVYRDRGFPLVVLFEIADPILRDREAPELVRLGRSLSEPEVQARFRDMVLAMDSLLRPEYVGLASEVNLMRRTSSPTLYRALREAVALAADGLRVQNSPAEVFVTVQVETAWGLLPSPGPFEGVERTLVDFPSITALGLSTYPWLGGFATPEAVPSDYFLRLVPDRRLPMLVVEGGWPSSSLPGLPSSPGIQARWIERQAELAASTSTVAVMQIPFTDLDPDAYHEMGPTLSLFASIGLVDTEFVPKPALAAWDRVFRRDLALPASASRTSRWR